MTVRRPRLALASLLAVVALTGRPRRLGAQVEAESSPSKQTTATVSADSCTRLLRRAQRDPNALTTRAAEGYVRGSHEVAAGSTVNEAVVTCGGNLDIY